VNKLKSIVLLAALLVLFVGNVGVNVYKHICKMEGVSTAYVIPPAEDHCKKEKPTKKICCSNSKQEQKDDCCND